MLNSRASSAATQEHLGASWSAYHGFSRESLNLSQIPNQLGGFTVELNSPLPSRNTKFCDAYLASCSDVEYTGQSYALVFKRNLPFRLQAILALSGSHLPGLVTPLAHGVVPISTLENQEHFVVIMPIIAWRSLQDVLDRGVVFDERFILEQFLPNILTALNHLHKNSIVHGRLNPKNIFLNEQNEIILDECFSELVGFSQDALFETVERAQALPFGKGDGSEKTDYYALGITLFLMLTGGSLKALHPKDTIAEKLRLNTFGFLIDREYVKGKVADIIKGLVMEDTNKRWSFLQVEAVLRNQSYAFDDAVDESIIPRALVFNDKEFYSPRALAYELSQNWDLAKEFIQNDKIKRWLQSSSAHTKMLSIFEGLKYMMSSARMMGQKFFVEDDEFLIRALIVLDPYGPIRAHSLVFFKEGVKTMLLSSIVGGQNEAVQIVVHTILSGIYDVFDRLSSILNNNALLYGLPEIRKAIKILSKTELGYGMDRFLYETIPSLVCQDVTLKQYFCISHHDVLVVLEQQKVNFDDIASRRAITSFLAAKMTDASIDNMIKSLQLFPVLYKSKAFQVSSFLALAQYYGKIETLPHLSQIVRDELKQLLIEHIYSKVIKEQIMQKIDEAAETFSLADVVRAAASTHLLLQDTEGHKKAQENSRTLLYQITFYQQNKKDLEMSAYHKALRAAVNISYIMLILVCLKILLQIN